MNARCNLLAAISFNDAANAGSTPEELVDAYRKEVLAEAQSIVQKLSDSARQTADQIDEADGPADDLRGYYMQHLALKYAATAIAEAAGTP